MPEDILTGVTLIVDDPAMYLDERNNPRTGRRLIYRLPDETSIEVQVTIKEYKDPTIVKAKLIELVKAHLALRAF